MTHNGDAELKDAKKLSWKWIDALQCTLIVTPDSTVDGTKIVQKKNFAGTAELNVEIYFNKKDGDTPRKPE